MGRVDLVATHRHRLGVQSSIQREVLAYDGPQSSCRGVPVPWHRFVLRRATRFPSASGQVAFRKLIVIAATVVAWGVEHNDISQSAALDAVLSHRPSDGCPLVA